MNIASPQNDFFTSTSEFAAALRNHAHSKHEVAMAVYVALIYIELCTACGERMINWYQTAVRILERLGVATDGSNVQSTHQEFFLAVAAVSGDRFSGGRTPDGEPECEVCALEGALRAEEQRSGGAPLAN